MYLINITPQDKLWYSLDNLPNEIWKPVVECPDCYLCSNYGRIKTIPRNGVSKNGRILSPSIKKDGYYQVVLRVYGTILYCRVNRIIAQAFIPNPQNKPVVDHIDNCKLNNKVDNLQWLTNAENIQKYNKEVYDGKYKGRGRIKSRKVKAHKIGDNNYKIYDSLFICALELFNNKNKRGGISKACRCKKPYLGYYFEYV